MESRPEAVRPQFRTIRLVIVAVVVSVFIWSVVIMVFEEQFVFFPTKYPQGNYLPAQRAPYIQDHWFKSEDDVPLHAWFLHSENAIATLFISHGNAGNISYSFDLLRRLWQAGYNVFIYDYRGYGRSGGKPSEVGAYKDSRAAYDYAVALPGVEARRIFLWGTSLGGAVTVELARHRPAAGMILECAFTSAKDLAKIHYPYLPTQFLLRSKFNAIDKISSLHLPSLFIHGTNDAIAPLDLARQLYQAANEPKEFFEIPGADHNDTYIVGGEEYFLRLDRFVKSAIGYVPAKR